MGWAPRTAVCEAVRAWIVLPQAKVVLLRLGSLANHARGTCPAAPEGLQGHARLFELPQHGRIPVQVEFGNPVVG